MTLAETTEEPDTTTDPNNLPNNDDPDGELVMLSESPPSQSSVPSLDSPPRTAAVSPSMRPLARSNVERQMEREPLLMGDNDLRTSRAPRRLPPITDDDLQGLDVRRPPGGGSTGLLRTLSSAGTEAREGTSGGQDAEDPQGVEGNDQGSRRFSRAPGGYAPGAPISVRRPTINFDHPIRTLTGSGPQVSLPRPQQVLGQTGGATGTAQRPSVAERLNDARTFGTFDRINRLYVRRYGHDDTTPQARVRVLAGGRLSDIWAEQAIRSRNSVPPPQGQGSRPPGRHIARRGTGRNPTPGGNTQQQPTDDEGPDELSSTVALLRELRSRLQGIDPALSTARATLADARADIAEIRATIERESERRSARRATLGRGERGSDDPSNRLDTMQATQRPQGADRLLTTSQLPSPAELYPGHLQPFQPAQRSDASGPAPIPGFLPSDSVVPNRHPHPPTPEPPEVQPTAVPSLDVPPTAQAPTSPHDADLDAATPGSDGLDEPGLPAWLNELRDRVVDRTVAARRAKRRPTRKPVSRILSQATLTRAVDVLVAGTTMDRSLTPLAAAVDLVALHLVLTAHLSGATLQYADAPLPSPQRQGRKTNEPKRLHLNMLHASQSLGQSDTAAIASYDIPGVPALVPPLGPLPIDDLALYSQAQHRLRVTFHAELTPVDQKLNERSWDPVWELSVCTDILDGGIPWRTTDSSSPDSVADEMHQLREWSHKVDLTGGVSHTHLRTLPWRLLASRTLALLRHVRLRLNPATTPSSSAPLLDLTKVQLTRAMDYRTGSLLETRDGNQARKVRLLPAPLGMTYGMRPDPT